MSTTVPTWDEFAWATFLYGAIGGDDSYQSLMKKNTFLTTLRHNPHNLTIQGIRTDLLAGFLNKWRCRIENNNQSAVDLKNELQLLAPFLSAVMGYDISTVNFNYQISVNGNMYTIEQIIKKLYRHYREIGHRFGPTCTSKLLHILDPNLFVMWDSPIITYYKKLNLGISGTSQGYFNYLRLMQYFAQQINQNFQHQTLNPIKLPNQTQEDYLSKNMSYNPQKTMAKYLDEYNWVTITNKVTVPPAWHP